MKKELKFKLLYEDHDHEIFIYILNISMNNLKIKQKIKIKIEQLKKTVEKVKFLVKKEKNKKIPTAKDRFKR